MKVFGDINKLSKEMIPVKPAKGTVVIYQFLNGIPDFNNPKKLNYPTKKIKTWDTIQDRVTGDYVDIGVGPHKARDIASKTEFTKFATMWMGDPLGFYALTIGSNEADEMFEFMELSNENELNPHRDPSVTPMFRKLDVVADAKGRSGKLNVLRDALGYHGNMSDAEKREFAAAMAWNENEDMILLDDAIGEFAKNQPKAFIDFFNDPELKDKALLKNAFTKGVLRHDPTTNKIYWKDGTNAIAVLDRQDGVTYIDSFAEWLRTQKAGSSVMAMIRKRMNEHIRDTAKALEPAE